MGEPSLLPRDRTVARGRRPGWVPLAPDNLPLWLIALIPLAIALIVAKDVLLRRASLVVSGITDEPAHVVTALLAVGALYALLRRPLTTGVIVGTIFGGTLIDLDHIPLALGRDWLTTETDRPFTHSMLVLILLLLIAVALRGSRREVGLVTALALVSHFIEDMGDGNVPLLWPVRHHGVSLPYTAYLGMLLVCAGIIVLRQFAVSRPFGTLAFSPLCYNAGMKLSTNRRRDAAYARGRRLLNKVPEITVYFWVVKVLCTTVGETAADFLNVNLHLRLTGTTLVMGSLLLMTLFFQFRSTQYVSRIYWLAVVLISVAGTLITDNLTDNFGVPLEATTVIFAVALVVTFASWYASEKTLSIHTIDTTCREAFYWLAILFTFALGTAAGDLAAETLKLGYLVSAIVFGVLIAVVTVAHLRFGLNATPAFWIAYILTRPLGASLGDYFSQDRDNGGLGLGTVVTSALFLLAIVATVTYLTVTKKDAAAPAALP